MKNGNGSAPVFACVKELNIKSLCVYLGSNEGDDPTFGQAVDEFGSILAANEIRLVCGGGGRGLMKRLVESVAHHGGRIIAITPKDLYVNEGNNRLIQDQVIVETMGERKLRMFRESDGFVAFPGGVGTFEEVVEQLTWRQLGHHKKPICFYNHKGFWDSTLDQFHVMRKRNLITHAQPIEYAVAHDVPTILPIMCGEMESCGRLRKRFNEDLFGSFENPVESNVVRS